MPWALLNQGSQLDRHRSFAVGIISTDPVDGDRQRKARGMMAHTLVSVSHVYQLRVDDAVDDYDRALDDEIAVMDAIQSVAASLNLSITVDSIPARRVGLDYIYTGEIRLLAHHRYPLQLPVAVVAA